MTVSLNWIWCTHRRLSFVTERLTTSTEWFCIVIFCFLMVSHLPFSKLPLIIQYVFIQLLGKPHKECKNDTFISLKITLAIIMYLLNQVNSTKTEWKVLILIIFTRKIIMGGSVYIFRILLICRLVCQAEFSETTLGSQRVQRYSYGKPKSMTQLVVIPRYFTLTLQCQIYF